MDWETFLVTSGQTFVIFIGCVLGVTAIFIYRIIARRDIVDGDMQRQREERQRDIAKGWSWDIKQ